MQEAVKFYDFTRLEVLNIYGDEDAVFAVLKVGIANSKFDIMLCEQFIFKQDKLHQIRVFIFDFENIPISSLIK